MNLMYTMQTRKTWMIRSFTALAAAVEYGFSVGVEFDVSSNSGALVWVWEMRR